MNISKIQVDNTIYNIKDSNAVSIVESLGLTDTEKANARDNIAAQPLIGIGTSTTAKATVNKIVSIPSITSLNVGLIIIVTPTITSTVANGAIKLNSFDAYPMHYAGKNVTTSTDSVLWYADVPSIFMFDGSSWEFLGHGLDSNTTYGAVTAAVGIAGTNTTAGVISAAVLKEIIDDRGYTSNEGTITEITMNGESVGTSGVVDLGTVITDVSDKVNNTTTVNGHALSSNVTVTKSDVGLSDVTNDAQVKRSEMGVASGVATLDSAGKVPSSQLPSYVDDVLEYDTKPDFPTTGEAGKIYVDKSTNTTWRWSGSAYTQIKGDLAIGATTGTAADGGIANTHYNNTSNPHSVTKSQVGLGSVVNTGDSATPVSGGTTKFTTGGAYTELNKKVDKVSGKGLSTNDYTTDEKNKLAGIAAGAEVNVQSDWNATDGDAFIKNKPTIPDSFQWFGTSSTAADTAQKEVSIPSITSLKAGQLIIVLPTVTSTVADSTLKLNSFDAYPMRYGNAAITTSTDSIVWTANYPSVFVFDGSYWIFLTHGYDSNTTYSTMSVAEGTTGTKTTARSISAASLKEIIDARGYTTNTGTVTSVAVKMNGTTKGTVTTSGTIDLGTVITDISGKVDNTTTVNGHSLSGNVSVTKSDVGLSNVTNDSQVKRSEMGVANGVAILDSTGKVPSSLLPSYVYGEIGYTVNTTTSAGGTLSLAGTTPLHVVTLTGNVSALTLSSNPADGHSCHVILTAASAQTVAIAHDAINRVCPGASDISLDVPAGGYVEIDFLSANNKVFVRGI